MSLLARYIAESAFCSTSSLVAACQGTRGDADAGADHQRPAVGDERMLQIVQHLARGQLGAIDVGRRQQHRELVAAEPRDRVRRAQGAAQPRRHFLQHDGRRRDGRARR